MTETAARRRVLLLGAGSFTAELAAALRRLGADVLTVVDQVARTDPGELSAAIAREQPELVVAGTAAVAVEALRLAAQSGDVEVVPSPRALRLAADRQEMRRLVADELGLPTVPFWFAGSAEELAAVTEQAGYPLVVTPVGASRPGDGQSVLVRPDDIEPAWRRAVAADGQTDRVLAESVIPLDYEVTQLVLADDNQKVSFCAPIGHRSTADGSALECWQPQTMTETALDTVRSVAARVVRSLGGRGLFAVQLAVRDDEVYFRDAGAFPCDAGVVTLRSQRLSQFDLAARAALGLPVDTLLISPGAARLLYVAPTGLPGAALAVPESDVAVLDSGATVLLATATDSGTATARVGQVAAALRQASVS